MDIKLLNRAFTEAYENPYTDFYRTLYISRGFVPSTGFPHDVGEWRNIPFLTKADLISVPVERRTFVRKEDVLFYRISSGTTNQGVMVIPRNFVPDLSARRRYTRRFLEFTSQHHFSHVGAERAGIEMIDADSSDLPASAALATLFKIDGIGVTPTTLAAFIPYLKEQMDTALIRYIFLTGDRMTPAKRALFFGAFPNARLETAYAASEIHGIAGYSCDEMIRAGVSYVHPRDDLVYWELIDPETGTVDSDFGEIVLTHLWCDNAFPALRYRTGDLAHRIKFPCACGLDVYDIVGRAQYDRAIVAGGIITSAELERALWPYQDHIEDDFQLHIYDRDSLPRLELLARPKEKVTLDAETIAKNVSEALRISPQETIASAVSRGLFAEFVCVLLPRENTGSNKQLRIFTH